MGSRAEGTNPRALGTNPRAARSAAGGKLASIRTSNDSEVAVARALEADGWTLYKRGWPDFLAVKDGQVRFIEVKPHAGQTLKPAQEAVSNVLQTLGHTVEILTPHTVGRGLGKGELYPEESTPGPRRNEVWDACVEALGYEPLTVSEKALWGKMTSSLRGAGATSDRILSVAEWYRRHWPDIDLTITAIEKWYSHFLKMAEAKNKAKAAAATFCDYCGRRDGKHELDCSRHLYEEG